MIKYWMFVSFVIGAILALFYLFGCEPIATEEVQSVDACEFEHAVPVPYQGCNRIIGEFRVARFDTETQQCVLSQETYGCYGAEEEVYVVGEYTVEEVESYISNQCDVCYDMQ